MREFNTAIEMEQELSINETVEMDKRDKLNRLYDSIQLLKDVVSSKILKDLKVCRKTCEDANAAATTVIGELNGVKKR